MMDHYIDPKRSHSCIQFNNVDIKIPGLF